MKGISWLDVIFGGGWLSAVIVAARSLIKDWRSGQLRKGRAQAADIESTVGLTGAERQIEIARKASEFLSERLAAAESRLELRDRQLADSDLEKARLRIELRDRDDKIDELERRIDLCSETMDLLRDELDQAKGQVMALRASRDPHGLSEPPPHGL